MINGVVVKRLNKYKDARGWLAEIYRGDEVNFKPAMAYISVTRPSVVRGPHEHVNQTDAFVFVGPGSFVLHLWDRRPSSAKATESKGERKDKHMELIVGEENPCLVIVPPGVVHGYKCVSDIDAYCVNLPDKLYKGENKQEKIDEIRWETDPESPYKIN